MDIETIKKKRKEVMDRRNNSTSDLWSPPKGETVKIRVVPNKFDEDDPFMEVHWHWNIAGKHMLCLNRNFGEDCPVCMLGNDLYRSDNEEDKDLAKNLFASMSFYVPIIVRGKEEEGVKYWRFGTTIYDALTLPIADGEVGDFTDIEEGRDILVTKKSPKEVGNTYGKTVARYSMSTSPMLPEDMMDEELVNKILDEDQKDIYEVLDWAKKDFDEMKSILQDWLEGDNNDDESSNAEDIVEDDDEEDIIEQFDNLMDEKADE